MRSELDPIRTAPLPDSFERTAEWLREAPSPHTRRAPATTLVALLLIIGACSWPVSTTITAGSVLEILSADRIGIGHPMLVTLEQIVPDEHPHLLDLVSVGEEGAGGTVVRYAVLGADRASAERWRDTVAAIPSTEAARVLQLDVTQRRPFGVFTVRRVLGTSPMPHLSDAQLRVELDRMFASADHVPIHAQRNRFSVRTRSGTRFERLPSGDTTATRVFFKSAEVGPGRPGFPLDQLLSGPSAVSFEMMLDSLPPDVARRLRNQLDERIRRIDSLHTASPSNAQVSQFIWIESDTLRRPLPPGARIDTVRTFLRIYSTRDSL